MFYIYKDVPSEHTVSDVFYPCIFKDHLNTFVICESTIS
jgi:hypothetical protein